MKVPGPAGSCLPLTSSRLQSLKAVTACPICCCSSRILSLAQGWLGSTREWSSRALPRSSWRTPARTPERRRRSRGRSSGRGGAARTWPAATARTRQGRCRIASSCRLAVFPATKRVPARVWASAEVHPTLRLTTMTRTQPHSPYPSRPARPAARPSPGRACAMSPARLP